MTDRRQDHQQDHQSGSEIANLSKLPIELSQVITQYVNSRRWRIVNLVELNQVLRDYRKRPISFLNEDAKIYLLWFIDESPSFLSFDEIRYQDKKRFISARGHTTATTLADFLLYDQVVDNKVTDYLKGFINHYQYLPEERDSISLLNYCGEHESINLALEYDGEGYVITSLSLQFISGKKPVLCLASENFEMVIPQFLVPGIIEILRQLSA